jgi:hypothetical protein
VKYIFAFLMMLAVVGCQPGEMERLAASLPPQAQVVAELKYGGYVNAFCYRDIVYLTLSMRAIVVARDKEDKPLQCVKS